MHEHVHGYINNVIVKTMCGTIVQYMEVTCFDLSTNVSVGVGDFVAMVL